MASATDICWNCKLYEPIHYVERDTLRAFCKPCALALPVTSDELALLFLEATCPFKVGDVVEARTAGEVLDGTGKVTQISTDLRNGGTRVFPAFHVVLDSKVHDRAPDDAWYTEICLKKVAA